MASVNSRPRMLQVFATPTATAGRRTFSIPGATLNRAGSRASQISAARASQVVAAVPAQLQAAVEDPDEAEQRHLQQEQAPAPESERPREKAGWSESWRAHPLNDTGPADAAVRLRDLQCSAS